MTKKRVLIISVKAGAGHMRAAQAIEAAFTEEHPEVEAVHVDALEYTNAAFRNSYTRVYNRLVMELPSVWGMIYESLEKKAAGSPGAKLGALIDRLNTRRILEFVRNFNPDAVVCTHYLGAEILGPRRMKGKFGAPVFVVLTDYDIHTMWIQQGVDHYFVASDEMAYALTEKKKCDATVSVTGIPVMPVFAKKYPSRQAMRKKLGLANVPTVLMSAGGFGLGDIAEVAGQLAEAAGRAQILAIAGKNKDLEEALREAAGRSGGRIVPFGFVTNMHELMAASDMAVTKSGGLTSSECMAMGLAMVIWNPIPGQEERNADYLLEKGLAVRAHSAAHLVFKVKKMLAEGEMLGRMQRAALAAGRPQAAYEIAREVIKAI